MIPPNTPILIIVNADEADGRDTSWLWDVDFAGLKDRPVIACGRRAADVGLRLSYAEVAHQTIPNALEALEKLPEGNTTAIANYTAFHQLSNDLLS